MTGGADTNVLDYLREQFRQVHDKLDRLIGDVDNPKIGMSSVESGLAEVNRRLDRMDTRLENLERHADIVKA